MDRPRVNYNQLAPTYDRRYSVDRLQGIEDALAGLVKSRQARTVLEAGCGTGRWLESLAPYTRLLCGIDSSFGMLQRAVGKNSLLAAAHANVLPFAPGSFDLIFSVNAIHHFDNPEMFIRKAPEFLTDNGALSIVGIDPRLIRRWYLYDYFHGVYEMDLRRYPSVGNIVNWMASAGFNRIDYRTVEVVEKTIEGRDILTHPLIQKESASQLALLSEESYRAGLRRMESAIEEAEKEGRQMQFRAELSFPMITGMREQA
jgi:Methylase involved in ubiquinone/menaquinone biosynthesis